MMATVLAGVAEFERELIQERIRSGVAAAKARGKPTANTLDVRQSSLWGTFHDDPIDDSAGLVGALTVHDYSIGRPADDG